MRIEEQLAELEELCAGQLRAEWRRLHRGQALPAGLTSSQLRRAIAWRLQEKAFGGLPSARIRELDRLAVRLGVDGKLNLPETRQLKPGTRLVRRWHDQVYTVTVLDRGFEFDGNRYASLTQIAKQITGVAWSGPRFFGMKRAAKETP